MDLVEREAALRTLRERLAVAGAGGHVVLVAGEAGIGKTSVLRALAHGYPDVWWGACDALQTPHPLAPLLDIARGGRAPGARAPGGGTRAAAAAGVRFGAALNGPRPALFEAVVDELRSAVQPMLMVIEDAHWADDATLDLLKFLGRRIERTHALLVISFRDDEVPPTHPLRRVIGELPLSALTRVDLLRLTPQAVDVLAARSSRSAAGVHAVTHGNPLFVTEMLRDDGARGGVPRSVQDLVLARLARLPEPSRALVQLASLVPSRVERGLIDELLAPRIDDLQACIDIGLLLADGEMMLAFRHELVREAVASSLSQPQAQALHARLLQALSSRAEAMPARLVHHAVGAHDHAAVSRLAPLAAEHAHERGARREAAAHWRTALRDGAPADEAERLEWLEAYAMECVLTGQLDATFDARAELGSAYRAMGDVPREALNASRLALALVLALRTAEAHAQSRRAIELLERYPPCVEQAHGLYAQARLRRLERECNESAQWARQAIAVAERIGDRETLAAAQNALGTALLFIDWERGVPEIEKGLCMAQADGLPWTVADGYVNLGSAAGELMRLPDAERWLGIAMDYAQAQEVDIYLNYATAWRALVDLNVGRWEDAAVHAEQAARRASPKSTSRTMALVALGRLRTRRGDPGAEEALDQALALADESCTLQLVAPVRAARAERAWMRGDLARAAAEAMAALPLAQARAHPWFVGELSMWCWRAGVRAATDGCAEPYAREIAGRWREAADAWAALGCPYERARALADGDTPAQLEALAIVDALGARPMADVLRRRLRDAGVRGVARGARESTRANPAGLTDAEMNVLWWLAQDLRNAAIAERLHRSVRTIEHHVTAVLGKLGVATRLEAVRRAEREAWLRPPEGR